MALMGLALLDKSETRPKLTSIFRIRPSHRRETSYWWHVMPISDKYEINRTFLRCSWTSWPLAHPGLLVGHPDDTRLVIQSAVPPHREEVCAGASIQRPSSIRFRNYIH